MNEVTSSIEQECERRLTNLFNESHNWLIQSAKKITKNTEEAECLVMELYEYLHIKKNQKLFWGDDSYNLFYCSKFLHSRFINKTKKLNRISYVEEIYPYEMDIPYDTEKDLAIQKAHEDVLEEITKLKRKKGFASAMIFEMYWMSDKTLDEVAKDIGISKSTTFLAVRKIRKYLKEVIDNPFTDEAR